MAFSPSRRRARKRNTQIKYKFLFSVDDLFDATQLNRGHWIRPFDFTWNFSFEMVGNFLPLITPQSTITERIGLRFWGETNYTGQHCNSFFKDG